jgi:hypothetical protein
MEELLYNRNKLRTFKIEKSRGIFKDFDTKTALSKGSVFA